MSGATGTSGAGNVTGGAGATGSIVGGGTAALTGGASGTGATGNGGAASHTGGAALSTNGTGGQANVTGGAGAGAGNGGNVVLTPGAGGSGGAAGTITLAGGVTLSALGTGTQVSCLGLTSGNVMVPLTGGPCGASSGITSFTLSPAFTSTPGTSNIAGTQTITNAAVLWPEVILTKYTSSHIMDTTSGVCADTGQIDIADGSASINFTFPNPGGACGLSTAASYTIGDLTGHGYTISTAGGTALFQGSGLTAATTQTIPANTTTNCVSDGTAWTCLLAAATGGGSGTVTSIVAGSGLSGGTITTTGTVSLNLGSANSWTAPQRTNTGTPAIATTTFTPVFSTSQNIRIDFPATTCVCTIANPAAIVAGQSGMFELVQGGTSASLDPTWGSEFVYAGGTSTITLTTTLGGIDYVPYYVDSTGSFIVLGGIILKPVH